MRNMQWVGVVPRLLGRQIVDARGAALMVIEMQLVVKVWDMSISREQELLMHLPRDYLQSENKVRT